MALNKIGSYTFITSTFITYDKCGIFNIDFFFFYYLFFSTFITLAYVIIVEWIWVLESTFITSLNFNLGVYLIKTSYMMRHNLLFFLRNTRVRAKIQPPLPDSAENIKLEEKHKVTIAPEPKKFLLYDNEIVRRLMVFCSPLGLKFLFCL